MTLEILAFDRTICRPHVGVALISSLYYTEIFNRNDKVKYNVTHSYAHTRVRRWVGSEREFIGVHACPFYIHAPCDSLINCHTIGGLFILETEHW